MATFIYNGQTFSPLKSGQDVMQWVQETIRQKKCTYLFSPDKNNWEWTQFYECAKTIGAEKFNFFLHNGNECLPCSGGLIERRN